MSALLADRLCASRDPSVAYRARRLLRGEDERSRTMRALRGRIAVSANARRLLKPHRELHPYAKWQGAHWTLRSLAEIGYPPGRAELLPLRERVFDWLLDPAFLQPPRTRIYQAQRDRPRHCASMEGNAIWSQVRLGIEDPDRTSQLVDRLVRFQWPDGGWNCDRREAARTSSVQETLIPMRGLFAWSETTGDRRARRSARRAAEFLLERRLLWRRRDGALIVPGWGGPVDRIQYPIRFYDVLSALVGIAEMGLARDPRCADALGLLRSKELPDGTFPVEWTSARTVRRVASHGTFADWGPRGRTRGNPFVTIDALYTLRAGDPPRPKRGLV